MHWSAQHKQCLVRLSVDNWFCDSACCWDMFQCKLMLCSAQVSITQELSTSYPSLHDKTCRQRGDSMPVLPCNRCLQVNVQRLSDDNSATGNTNEPYMSFCWQSESGCAFSWEDKEMMAGATNTRPAMSYRQSRC